MKLLVNGKNFEVAVLNSSHQGILFEINNKNYFVEKANLLNNSKKIPNTTIISDKKNSSNENEIFAEIPGMITAINVKENQLIMNGDTILILEAMKMQNRIICPIDCQIEKIFVTEGQEVSKNQILVRLKSSSS
jgi:pyruvate carboxylase